MATRYMERLQIPEGFEELLHDLIKEILREQPKNINFFCYQYFYTKQNGKKLDIKKPKSLKNVNQKIAKKKILKQSSIEVDNKKNFIKNSKGIVTEYFDDVKDDVINNLDSESLPTGIVTGFFDEVKNNACEKIYEDEKKN